MGCCCGICVVACKTMPGLLSPSDLANLPLDGLAASEGTMTHALRGTVHVNTIVPAQRPDGTCAWLKDGRCEVHEIKPWGCREFDSCDSDVDMLVVARKSAGLYQAIEGSALYAATWRMLNDGDRIARPVEERKAAYQAAIKKAERQKYRRSQKKGR